LRTGQVIVADRSHGAAQHGLPVRVAAAEGLQRRLRGIAQRRRPPVQRLLQGGLQGGPLGAPHRDRGAQQRVFGRPVVGHHLCQAAQRLRGHKNFGECLHRP